jgi:nucleotide-binding universal stress UspA family protein
MGSVADAVVRGAAVPVLLVHRRPDWRPGHPVPVLVPLDGSPRSEAIIPAVERLAGPLDFAIHLVHAVEPVPAGPDAPGSREAGLAHRTREGERYLAAIAARLESKGLRAHSAVRQGRAVDVIAAYVSECVIGLVAMSTHARSGLGRLLLGSVAERVLIEVEVPVILWKAPAGTAA